MELAVSTSWTNPASTNIDLAVGDVLTEAVYDRIISNLNVLGGTSGYVVPAVIASTGTWQVIYFNGSGAGTVLALGAKGTVLESQGASTAPAFKSTVKDLDTHRVMNY